MARFVFSELLPAFCCIAYRGDLVFTRFALQVSTSGEYVHIRLVTSQQPCIHAYRRSMVDFVLLRHKVLAVDSRINPSSQSFPVGRTI
jgi:hypothetical protein